MYVLVKTTLLLQSCTPAGTEIYVTATHVYNWAFLLYIYTMYICMHTSHHNNPSQFLVYTPFTVVWVVTTHIRPFWFVAFIFLTSTFYVRRITDTYSSLVLSVLSQLLVDGPVSPFYQSLIDSNIGAEYTPNTGLASNTSSICVYSYIFVSISTPHGHGWDILTLPL